MSRNDVLRFLAFWVVERFEKGDRSALEGAGVDPANLSCLAQLRAADFLQLITAETISFQVVINPLLLERIRLQGGGTQEWFLRNGAHNEMMRYLFPRSKNLHQLRQALDLEHSGGRPRVLSLEEMEEITKQYQSIRGFSLHLPGTWVELHSRCSGRFLLRQLWDVINDAV